MHALCFSKKNYKLLKGNTRLPSSIGLLVLEFILYACHCKSIYKIQKSLSLFNFLNQINFQMNKYPSDQLYRKSLTTDVDSNFQKTISQKIEFDQKDGCLRAIFPLIELTILMGMSKGSSQLILTIT